MSAGRPLSELLRAASRGGALPVPLRLPADPEVLGLAHDSSRAKPGDVFVGIRGATRDGADFAADAVRRGAVAVVAASPDRGLGVPWIVVSDDRAALADLAREVHGDPSARVRVHGITGTNGKTTTTSMLAAVLGTAGRPCGVIGTVETRWKERVIPASRTTPEASDLQRTLAEMERDGCADAALEVSSHALDLARVRALRFAAVAFTNLSQDHLDWHGGMEAYFAAKVRLFTELAPEAPAVIGVDDEHGRELAARLRAAAAARRVVRCGFADDADLRIESYRPAGEGAAFVLAGRAEALGLGDDLRVSVLLRTHGRHDAQNAALAAGLALATGAPASALARGLASFEGVAGRLELVAPDPGEDDGVRVVVDYAHTPAALEVALGAARELTAGRLICVFGCGGDRDRGKRAPMGRVVATAADVAIATSDNPRGESPEAILDMVREGLLRGTAESLVEPDRRKAIALALDLARPGDLVLVAGKGHETYQEIAGTRHQFDDRAVVRELRRARRGR